MAGRASVATFQHWASYSLILEPGGRDRVFRAPTLSRRMETGTVLVNDMTPTTGFHGQIATAKAHWLARHMGGAGIDCRGVNDAHCLCCAFYQEARQGGGDALSFERKLSTQEQLRPWFHVKSKTGNWRLLGGPVTMPVALSGCSMQESHRA